MKCEYSVCKCTDFSTGYSLDMGKYCSIGFSRGPTNIWITNKVKDTETLKLISVWYTAERAKEKDGNGKRNKLSFGDDNIGTDWKFN